MLDVEDFIERTNEELKDELKNHPGPTQEHMKIVSDTIETFHCQYVLSKIIADNLKTTNVKASHFYITRKEDKKVTPE